VIDGEGSARLNQFARITPVEPALVEAAGQGEQLDDELAQAGKAEGTVLERAVGIAQLSADHTGTRQGEQRVIQRPGCAGLGARVRVEQVDRVGTAGRRGALSKAEQAERVIVGPGKSQVSVAGDESGTGTLLANRLRRAIG